MSQPIDFYGNAGGGGYLTGGSPFGSASGSPGGLGRRGALSQSLRPITAKQFIQATQAHADADWVLENTELGQVTLVAHVVSVQKQTTNSIYMLDDGTGILEARHWSDSISQDEESRDDIVPNSFARVTGTIKTFGQKKYINASHIRPVHDAHEPFFHMLEVMTVQLIFDRGPPGSFAHGQAFGADGKPSLSIYSAQGPQSEVKDQYSHLQPVPRSIVQFMLNQPQTREGVHVSAIVKAVGADAEAIEQALERLMDDGIIFSTIDEAHFQVSQ
ncbi:replication protein A subunit RPA32 [Multifurca ochricompacta]|uniref:Replication protein A subunit RPA32 n=1 Tax=Multifurca ochricompacta TaxID=376703 RepID=A0AAD4MBC7_9AGAM|nr:replication protein A subunit RPA32 [Multifurca ochricompacta]